MVAERTRLEAELADLGLAPMLDLGAGARRFGPMPRGIAESRELEFEAAEVPSGPITVASLLGKLTNLVFWARNPKLRGQRLKAKTPQARAWSKIREDEVRPALRHYSPEFRLAQLLFFSWHPEVRGKFATLAPDRKKTLGAEFLATRADQVRPWLGLRLARGAINSRTLFVLDDRQFKRLPGKVRSAAGREIDNLFAFLGVTVVFLEEDRFPEAYNFSDAVVRLVADDSSGHVSDAFERQTTNAFSAGRQYGFKREPDLRKRQSRLPDDTRVGTGGHGKTFWRVGSRKFAVPVMASAVSLGDLIEQLQDRLGDKFSADPAKWSTDQQEVAGVALGRAMAHEARHCYLADHASAGQGQPGGGDLIGDHGHATFSRDDQRTMQKALATFEKDQGSSTVIETFREADRDRGFVF